MFRLSTCLAEGHESFLDSLCARVLVGTVDAAIGNNYNLLPRGGSPPRGTPMFAPPGYTNIWRTWLGNACSTTVVLFSVVVGRKSANKVVVRIASSLDGSALSANFVLRRSSSPRSENA